MNLLLVSVDSLRLDAVSRTNPLMRTPRFDRVSRHFCFCDRCFSVSSATRPVHTTLFTGLYPFEHGIQGQHYTGMRAGAPHLFELFAARNYAVGAFSEAPDVFAHLEYAPWISGFSQDRPGLVERFVERHHPRPCLVFVHYWGAHTPYGAPDGRAWGETWELLRAGQIPLVRQRYLGAIECLFEQQLAPLLERLDLRQWGIVLLSDHGQSWTAAEPYHGQTLANSVLRIPLYLHLPGTGNLPLPRTLVSLIDLFPTLVALFDLPVAYQGYGIDLRRERTDEPYLAQIDPGPGRGDLTPPDRQEELAHGRPPGRQWALFDANRKFTWDEEGGHGRLQTTLGEEPLPDQGAALHYQALYARMRAESRYAHLPVNTPPPGQQARLEERLRALGYL